MPIDRAVIAREIAWYAYSAAVEQYFMSRFRGCKYNHDNDLD